MYNIYFSNYYNIALFVFEYCIIALQIIVINSALKLNRINNSINLMEIAIKHTPTELIQSN